jgi:hypothetical protein
VAAGPVLVAGLVFEHVGEGEAVVAQAYQVPAVDGVGPGGDHRAGDGALDWVIVSRAFAVAARFFSRYATMLAKAGFGAVTDDYRGIGASGPDSLRGLRCAAQLPPGPTPANCDSARDHLTPGSDPSR